MGLLGASCEVIRLLRCVLWMRAEGKQKSNASARRRGEEKAQTKKARAVTRAFADAI
jgi:hypothetical protein